MIKLQFTVAPIRAGARGHMLAVETAHSSSDTGLAGPGHCSSCLDPDPELRWLQPSTCSGPWRPPATLDTVICSMLDIHRLGGRRVSCGVTAHQADTASSQWSCAMINQQRIVNYHYLRLLTIRTLYLVLKTLDRLQQAPAVISITLITMLFEFMTYNPSVSVIFALIISF